MPLQSPDAVQMVAFEDVHVSCAALPCVNAGGEAVSVSVGAGGITLTVTVRNAAPPAPVQFNKKSVVCVSGALVSEPEVARAPDQPPPAVQAVAFVVDQASDVVLPLAIDAGVAVRVTVGCGGAVT